MKILIWMTLFEVFVYGQDNLRDCHFNQEISGIFNDYRLENKFGEDDNQPALGIVNRAEYNPCEDDKEVPQPDFNVPGRRVSEARCYEYIWKIKERDNWGKKYDACVAYRAAHPGYIGGPYFAIGGHPTSPGEYPHMAAVGWKASTGTWIFKCGGTLISKDFVLTAAHCSQTSPRDTSVADHIPKIVRLGDKNIADVPVNGLKPDDIDIAQIIVHPSYKAPGKYYDIALIKLKYFVYFSKLLAPACLWSKSDVSILGTEAVLTGWGVTETTGRTTSPELQAAEVDVISSAICDQLLRPSCNRHWCGVKNHQLCAGKLAGGVDACQGDSGGPLQVKINLPVKNQGQMSFVIGVTSFGIGCARANTPGVYTRVSSFIDWIEENVWPKNTTSK